MATRDREIAPHALDLPHEFEDLTGLIQTDLRAIVSAVTQRAGERLLLTRKEERQLRQKLWDRLTDAVNVTVAPLSADCR